VSGGAQDGSGEGRVIAAARRLISELTKHGMRMEWKPALGREGALNRCPSQSSQKYCDEKTKRHDETNFSNDKRGWMPCLGTQDELRSISLEIEFSREEVGFRASAGRTELGGFGLTEEDMSWDR